MPKWGLLPTVIISYAGVFDYSIYDLVDERGHTEPEINQHLLEQFLTKENRSFGKNYYWEILS